MIVNVFISQPMNGKSDYEIAYDRDRIIKFLKSKITDADIRILDSICTEELGHPLRYLGRSIEIMADADIVIMAKGWQKARGCVVEHEVAKQYNICIIEEV